VSDLRKALSLEEEPGGTEIAKRQKQAVARAEELAEEIRKEYERAWGFRKSEVRSCMKVGALLLQAKEAVPHGAWEEWISNNFPFTTRTASNWMRMHQNKEEVERLLAERESETVSDSLTMREVLKALAPPKPKPSSNEAQENEEEGTHAGVTRSARYQPIRIRSEAQQRQDEEESDVADSEATVESEVDEWLADRQAEVAEEDDDAVEGEVVEEETPVPEVEERADDHEFLRFSDEERELLDIFRGGKGIVVNIHRPGPHQNLVAWLKKTNQLTRADRATPWGNPFIEHEDGDRETVIRKFRQFYLAYKNGLLEKLPTMAGTAWGCWCAPAECHCNAYLAKAEGKQKEAPPPTEGTADPVAWEVGRALGRVIQGEPKTNSELLQRTVDNIYDESRVLHKAWEGDVPVAFFEGIPDEELERVSKQIDDVVFFVQTIGNFSEQILEERRERAQGQTSILDSEARDEEPSEESPPSHSEAQPKKPRRVSKRVKREDYPPNYPERATIFEALVDLECLGCGKTIEPGEHFFRQSSGHGSLSHQDPHCLACDTHGRF
jgi:hypothetical protein